MEESERKLKCPVCGEEIETILDLVEHKRTCKAKAFDAKSQDTFGKSVRRIIGWTMIVFGVPLIAYAAWATWYSAINYTAQINSAPVDPLAVAVMLVLFSLALIIVGAYVQRR